MDWQGTSGAVNQVTLTRRPPLGCTTKNFCLLCAMGTLIMSTLIAVASFMRLGHDVTAHDADKFVTNIWEWQYSIVGCSLVSIVTTIVLIWGLYNNSTYCIMIWLVVFVVIFFVTVVAELNMMFHAKSISETDFREGRFVFLILLDIFIYFQMLLYSHYRSVLKSSGQPTITVMT